MEVFAASAIRRYARPGKHRQSCAMITEIDDYFLQGCGRCARFGTEACSTRLWAGGLADLRRICRDLGLVETVKWGHPCYLHAGRNIAIIGALRGGYRLSFFNAALMTDPEGLLERQGQNTQHPNVLRFATDAQVTEREPAIRAYLAEAMGYAEAGVAPPKEVRETALPDELVEVLDADPTLAEAFHELTPGRQRSYVIALGAAKRRETRLARIERYRSRILAGKGAQER